VPANFVPDAYLLEQDSSPVCFHFVLDRLIMRSGFAQAYVRVAVSWVAVAVPCVAIGSPPSDGEAAKLKAVLAHQESGWSTVHAQLFVIEGRTRPLTAEQLWGIVETIDQESMADEAFRESISNKIRPDVTKGRKRAYHWSDIEIWGDRQRVREENHAGATPRLSISEVALKGTYRRTLQQADVFPNGFGNGEKICDLACFWRTIPVTAWDDMQIEIVDNGEARLNSGNAGHIHSETLVEIDTGFVRVVRTYRGEGELLAETRQHGVIDNAGGIAIPRLHVAAKFQEAKLYYIVISFFRLAEFDMDLPDDIFKLAVNANTKVVDHTGDSPRVTLVQVPVANVFDLDSVEKAKMAEVKLPKQHLGKESRRRWTLIGFNLLLIVAFMLLRSKQNTTA